jgi:hypothetical protein
MIIRYKRTLSLKDEKGIRKLAKYFYQKVDKIIPLKTKVNDEKQLSDQVLNRHKHFDSFYEDYFKTSDQQYFTIDELKKNPPEADVYIAGSDQIWNWENRYGYNPVYFLQFGGSEIKKIGYAVGMSKIVDSKEARKELKEYLKSFNALALREPTGLTMLKNSGFKNPVVVADPTLLLEKEDYTLITKNIEKPKQDYVLGYFINFNNKEELNWSSIKDYLKEGDLDFKYISSEGYLESINEIDGYKNEFYDIPEWLSAYQHAKCILTTSYHGLLFSIIMRKPFLFFFIEDERTIPGRNRPKYILEQLGLESRIYFKGSGRSLKDQLDEHINWNDVEKKLKDLKNYSSEFLINSIEN